MAGALSHDILDRGARAFRASALAVGAAATTVGLLVAAFSINILVGWAFAIAGSSLCPLLVLGIWWPRLTRVGALAGLVVGGGTSSAAVVASLAGVGSTGWPAVLLGTPATWTVPLAFLVMIVGSLLSRSTLPADVTQKLLALHLPEPVRSPGMAERA
jgi:Na+(H+)/acetate symporter ActP